EYNKHLKEAIRNVKLKPGALKLLNHLKSHKIPMGLCTALNKKDFQFETEHFNDIGLFEIGKYFEVIVTAEDDADVCENKPSPIPYLVTINRFRNIPKPENVLVFEDSNEGIQSAVFAGTQCVMLQDVRQYENTSQLVVITLTSFNDFKPELFSLPKYE
ncbi:Pseudouridine-5'-monophosphatase-like protein, partial [Leptotrombidium deliense]